MIVPAVGVMVYALLGDAMGEFENASANAGMRSDAVVSVGEYSLPNSGELGDQMLQRVQKIMDPYSQAQLASMIKAGGRYLDIGAGLGSMSRFMAKKAGDNGSVVALDLDDSFFSIVPQGQQNVETIKADINTYELGEAQFDGIYVRLVFLHFTQNDNQALINKLAKALKPNGFLVIEDFVDGANPNRFIEFAKVDPRIPAYTQKIYQMMAGHMDFDQGYQLPMMMEKAGLTIKQVDMHIERAKGGSVHGEHMRIVATRLVPYLVNMSEHHELFPKLLESLMNPELNWYAHTRLFVAGYRSEE